MKKSFGFTYIEVSVVMSIMLVLLTLAIGSITGIRQKVTLNSSIDAMTTDINEQQLKAMVGETEGRSSHDAYGIYLRTSDYIFFHGLNYVASDPYNFTVQLNGGVQISSVTFPGSKIVFDSRRGELVGFTAGNNTFILRQGTSGEQKTITINRYGTISSIQ